MDPNRCQIVVNDVGSGNDWIGDKTPKLVLLVFAHEFDVKALAEVFHRLLEYRVIHQLVQILLEPDGCLSLQLGVHPDVGLHPGSLLESEGTMDLFQTHNHRQEELVIAVVEHLAFLVAEVGDQLFDLGKHLPNSKKVVLVL